MRFGTLAATAALSCAPCAFADLIIDDFSVGLTDPIRMNASSSPFTLSQSVAGVLGGQRDFQVFHGSFSTHTVDIAGGSLTSDAPGAGTVIVAYNGGGSLGPMDLTRFTSFEIDYTPIDGTIGLFMQILTDDGSGGNLFAAGGAFVSSPTGVQATLSVDIASMNNNGNPQADPASVDQIRLFMQGTNYEIQIHEVRLVPAPGADGAVLIGVLPFTRRRRP